MQKALDKPKQPTTITGQGKSQPVIQVLAFIEQQGSLIQKQAEQIQKLKDENTRLKNQPTRPDIKPSSLRIMKSAQQDISVKSMPVPRKNQRRPIWRYTGQN